MLIMAITFTVPRCSVCKVTGQGRKRGSVYIASLACCATVDAVVLSYLYGDCLHYEKYSTACTGTFALNELLSKDCESYCCYLSVKLFLNKDRARIFCNKETHRSVQVCALLTEVFLLVFERQ